MSVSVVYIQRHRHETKIVQVRVVRAVPVSVVDGEARPPHRVSNTDYLRMKVDQSTVLRPVNWVLVRQIAGFGAADHVPHLTRAKGRDVPIVLPDPVGVALVDNERVALRGPESYGAQRRGLPRPWVLLFLPDAVCDVHGAVRRASAVRDSAEYNCEAVFVADRGSGRHQFEKFRPAFSGEGHLHRVGFRVCVRRVHACVRSFSGVRLLYRPKSDFL